MPKGPKGEKRPADVIGAAVKVLKIATGEIEEDVDDDGKNKAAVALLEHGVGVHGGLDRRALAVALHEDVGGAVDVEIREFDHWGQLPLQVYPPAVRDFARTNSMQKIAVKEAPHGVVTVAKKHRIVLVVRN